jgi:hypothetical protein
MHRAGRLHGAEGQIFEGKRLGPDAIRAVFSCACIMWFFFKHARTIHQTGELRLTQN